MSLSCDWADVPAPVRGSLGGFPIVPPRFLDGSLAALDAAVAPR